MSRSAFSRTRTEEAGPWEMRNGLQESSISQLWLLGRGHRCHAQEFEW